MSHLITQNKHIKFCIDCGKPLNTSAHWIGTKRCQSCAKRGKLNHTFGKSRPKKIKEKISKSLLGNIPWNKGMAGGKSPQFKGDRFIDKDGHYRAWDTKKLSYRPEHRIVMEKTMNKTLPQSLIVHHKDNNRINNKIENLAIMERSEHSKWHRLERVEIEREIKG